MYIGGTFSTGFKVFDLESKSYIETLFGHQDAIQAKVFQVYFCIVIIS